MSLSPRSTAETKQSSVVYGDGAAFIAPPSTGSLLGSLCKTELKQRWNVLCTHRLQTQRLNTSHTRYVLFLCLANMRHIGPLLEIDTNEQCLEEPVHPWSPTLTNCQLSATATLYSRLFRTVSRTFIPWQTLREAPEEDNSRRALRLVASSTIWRSRLNESHAVFLTTGMQLGFFLTLWAGAETNTARSWRLVHPLNPLDWLSAPFFSGRVLPRSWDLILN